MEQQYAEQRWDGGDIWDSDGREWQSWEHWDDLDELPGIAEPTLPVKAALAGTGCVFLLLAAAWWLLMAAWLC